MSKVNLQDISEITTEQTMTSITYDLLQMEGQKVMYSSVCNRPYRSKELF